MKTLSGPAFAGIAAVVILVGGGLIYWRMPSSTLPPEKVVATMFENLRSAKSFRSSSEVQIFLNYDTIFAKEPSARAYGAFLPFQASSSPLSFVIGGIFDMNEKSPAFDQTITFRLNQEDQKIEGSVEIIFKNNVQYLQLAKAPLWGFVNLQPFAHKWIKIDQKEFEAQTKQFGGQVRYSSSTTSEQFQKIREALANYTFLTVTKTLREETVDGAVSYHYEVKLNSENILSFMEDYLKKVSEKTAKFWKEEDKKKLLAVLGGIHGELWVGKTDLYPRKMTVVVPFQDGKDSYGKATAEVLWSGFNVPVTITEPASAVSIQEFVKTFFGPMMPTSTPRGAKVQSKIQAF